MEYQPGPMRPRVKMWDLDWPSSSGANRYQVRQQIYSGTPTILYDGSGTSTSEAGTGSRTLGASVQREPVLRMARRSGTMKRTSWKPLVSNLAARLTVVACSSLFSNVLVAAEVTYYHTDALGSVVAVTDAAGTAIERREYEPYGAQLRPAASDGPDYTGHVHDAATGLVYMQQRYYDPNLGLFLSVDPVAVTSQGANFNRCSYAGNNPFGFKDPDGRHAQKAREEENYCDINYKQVRQEERRRARNSPFGEMRLVNVEYFTHEYNFTSRLCVESSFGCTPRNMMAIGVIGSVPGGVVPTAGEVTMLPSLIPGRDPNNPVTQILDWENHVITNIALPSHVFAGTVTHRFFSSGGSVYINTHGVGGSSSAWREGLNMLVGYAYFRGVYHPSLVIRAQSYVMP